MHVVAVLGTMFSWMSKTGYDIVRLPGSGKSHKKHHVLEIVGMYVQLMYMCILPHSPKRLSWLCGSYKNLYVAADNFSVELFSAS